MTTFGIDVSAYQSGLDLTHAADQGYQFAIAKVTEGSGYRDPHFAEFHRQAKAAGMLFAAYHFLHDGDVASQVANLAAALGRVKVPVMIDCEPSGSSRPTMAHAHQFRQLCKQRGIDVTLLYLPGWWHSQIGSPSLRGWRTVQSAYPSSRHAYGSELYPGDGGSGWAAFGGHGPFLWQFASTGHIDGYSGNVDLDAFKGDRAHLAREGVFRDYDGHPDHKRAKKAPKPAPTHAPVPDARTEHKPEPRPQHAVHDLEHLHGKPARKRLGRRLANRIRRAFHLKEK